MSARAIVHNDARPIRNAHNQLVPVKAELLEPVFRISTQAFLARCHKNDVVTILLKTIHKLECAAYWALWAQPLLTS